MANHLRLTAQRCLPEVGLSENDSQGETIFLLAQTVTLLAPFSRPYICHDIIIAH